MTDLLKLANDLHVPKFEKVDERLEALKRTLNRLESEYLLIFDGVDTPDAFDEIQKHLPDRGKCLLVTSRLKEQWERDSLSFESIELNPLTIEEAIEYLLTATGSQDKEAAQHLSETLGRLPLALTHAASYIREQKCTIQDYLRSIQKI